MRIRGILALQGAFILYSGLASAAQVVVFDSHWVHSADIPDSHFRRAPLAATPDSWVAPTNYAGGSAWVWLEVLGKPTDEPTRFQVCFEATPTYACTAQSPTYTTTGRLEWETPFNQLWSPPGESVDWTQGTENISVILKDTLNNKPSADNVGPEVHERFMPTEVRVVVTLVSPGGTYEPPEPYEPPPPDAGAAGGASSGGAPPGGAGGAPTSASGGATGSGGTLSTGGASAGGASSAGGTPSTAGGATGAGGAATGSGGHTGGASGDPDAGSSGDSADEAGEGCGCRVGSSSLGATSLGAAAVAASLLLSRRRRRRSRADG